MDELGDTARQRPDMAMAFIGKAVRSLKPGGVLGCVLPASLLTSRTGLLWREQLSKQGTLQLLGCFEGYRYFPTSLVETAFLIYKKHEGQGDRSKTVEVLISDEGLEDAALRTLRRQPEVAAPIKGVEWFRRSLQAFSPRVGDHCVKVHTRRETASLPSHCLGSMIYLRLGRVCDTGSKRVFVLKASQYEELGRKERKFFRPAAGGGSIRGGQLRPWNTYFIHMMRMDVCSEHPKKAQRQPANVLR